LAKVLMLTIRGDDASDMARKGKEKLRDYTTNVIICEVNVNYVGGGDFGPMIGHEQISSQ